MARISSKIQVIDRDILASIPEMAEDRMNQMFRDFATEQRDLATAHNKGVLGYTPDYDTKINGNPGSIRMATIKSVIDVEYQLATVMYEWIADILTLLSPVGKASDPRPGHPTAYARSHVMFVDGIEADPAAPVGPHDEVVFVNVQPYARKIERGHSAQAPNGVYEVVASMAKQRFSNYGLIRFGYRTPAAMGAIHSWAGSTKMQSPYRGGEKRDEWLRRQPAIIITL